MVIEVRGVSKWYGEFQVLDNCTTQIAKGEVVVVCGPSGSGKSTLIEKTLYRAAARAKSKADMVNKLKIVEEEADETIYWLDLLVKSELVPENRLKPLMNEVEQVVALTVASIKTIRANQRS